MKKSYNKGFTLVELLAVIVILAIILVIAVPKIMDVINSSKKSTLETSVKMIASAAEKTKMQNTLLGKNNDVIKCEDVAKLSSSDYDLSTCKITFTNSTAKVTVKGKGKFDGLYVCGGTKSQATAQTEECSANTLATHIQSLYETNASNNGLIKDNTTDENIRYAGSNTNVKNYVAFLISQNISYNNNGLMQIADVENEEDTPSTTEQEIWRIIGIFEVETSSGTTEELVKEESIGDMPWDVSDSNINNGWGINQWGASGDYEGADLMRYLNGKNSSSQTNPEPKSSTNSNIYATRLSESLNDPSTDNYSINTTLSNMIETVVWNTGAVDGNDTEMVSMDPLAMYTLNWYNYEREMIGTTCTGGNNCTDTVERTSTWTGKIALPYASDWAYASSTKENDSYVCHTNMWAGGTSGGDFTNGKCKQNNWMHTQSEMSEATWMLSPLAHTDSACHVSRVFGVGLVGSNVASNSAAVRPAIYLKSNVQINSGTGAQNDPYILRIEEPVHLTVSEIN